MLAIYVARTGFPFISCKKYVVVLASFFLLTRHKVPWNGKRVFVNYTFTGFSGQIGTKLRDWAVGQAGGQLLLPGSIVLK